MEDTGGFATNVAGNSRFFNSEENTVSVMFVEATPHGELIRLLKETEEKHMVAPDKRIKFVEKCGQKQIDTIRISNPFRLGHVLSSFNTRLTTALKFSRLTHFGLKHMNMEYIPLGTMSGPC